ncbi:MAG: hypothetical protein M3237_11805, partial [Actinomycetota bacterium]|nr:hypothetical protein [Actinomycetota bacterium]
SPRAATSPSAPEPAQRPTHPAQPARTGGVLPHGGRRIFDGNRFLVAYYGTGGTGALGVLGEDPPAVMHQRLLRAAAPFRRPGRPVTPVYELIVTVADATPGPDGDYSHDIDRETVELYVRAAHDRGALLLLDIQPGRADFKAVARRWAWALRYPNVGLALDPEWRMRRGEVPARVIGSVTADEVNRTSAWLSRLVADSRLPEKLFVLHQFRTDMIEDIALVRRRQGLALVQHVDGFGTPAQKLSTFHTVEHASKFQMGFKLFYDEDTRRMGPREVHRMRPPVRFVSFQ